MAARAERGIRNKSRTLLPRKNPHRLLKTPQKTGRRVSSAGTTAATDHARQGFDLAQRVLFGGCSAAKMA
jgi:hypothetical protein